MPNLELAYVNITGLGNIHKCESYELSKAMKCRKQIGICLNRIKVLMGNPYELSLVQIFEKPSIKDPRLNTAILVMQPILNRLTPAYNKNSNYNYIAKITICIFFKVCKNRTEKNYCLILNISICFMLQILGGRQSMQGLCQRMNFKNGRFG